MTFYVLGVVLHGLRNSWIPTARPLAILDVPLQDPGLRAGAGSPSPVMGSGTGGGGGGGGSFARKGGSILDNVSPLFGAAAFFLAGLIKLSPQGRIAGLLIGVGGAVINWGAGSASDGTTGREGYNDPSSLYL